MRAGNLRRIVFMVVAAVLACAGMLPFAGATPCYADFYLQVEKTGGNVASAGDTYNDINFKITNGASDPQTITGVHLSFYDSGMVKVRGGVDNETILSHGNSMDANFSVDVSKNASGRIQYQLVVSVMGQGDVEYNYELRIDERLSYRANVDFTMITVPADGLDPGADNSITFEAFNRSNTTIRNAQLSISLPAGMWVRGDSNEMYVGYLSTSTKVAKTFPITVDDSLAGMTYPVTIRITGVDMSEQNVDIEKTFYVPVLGDKAGDVKDISIESIGVPPEVTANEDFPMSFSVKNSGGGTIKNLKAYAEIPDGILNKSNATFVIDSIKAGETKTFSVTMFARESSNKSYAIKIAVEPLDGGTGSVAQYASVFVRGAAGEAATPQLMVDQYSYGGSSVVAGKEFSLNIGFFNTSVKTLSNIKVTLASDDGTFVPVNSSNSFFIESVEGGGHFTQTMRLTAKPSAEQKTTPVRVTMSYEDGDGGAYTADDTISIPVMQPMRLSVDEIIPPGGCYVGAPGSCTLQFYNLGKTTLNNLMINAEGNFDVMESNSYYAGNMEGGRSDSYTFVFIPREVGPMEGRVVFTYEDLDGMQITYEVPFVFQIMEMPVYEDMYPPEVPVNNSPLRLILICAAVVIVVAGIIVWRKIRKARLHKKLEIQDAEFNAAMDLEKDRNDR